MNGSETQQLYALLGFVPQPNLQIIVSIYLSVGMYSELIQTAKTILGEFQLAKSDLTAGAVSCALMTNRGNIYTGICLDLACGIGFCAEHSAIAEMLKARETTIYYIVAVSSQGIMMPCGRCRELMMQVNQENINTKIVIDENSYIVLKDLLPKHWL